MKPNRVPLALFLSVWNSRELYRILSRYENFE